MAKSHKHMVLGRSGSWPRSASWRPPLPKARARPQTQQALSSPAPQAQPADKYVVGRALPPIDLAPGTKMMDLTLEQAVMLALEKNLELKASKMDPQLVDYQIAAARASFIPQITSRYSFSNSTSPSNNTLEGVTSLTNIGQTYNGGMSQTLPWFGSSVLGELQQRPHVDQQRHDAPQPELQPRTSG